MLNISVSTDFYIVSKNNLLQTNAGFFHFLFIIKKNIIRHW